MAYGRGCVPSAPVSFKPTPAAISVSAIGTSPLAAANRNGVKPSAVDVAGSAPPLSRARATFVCEPATAHINAVPCVATVRAFTSAPSASSTLTTGRLPVRAATMSGVRPLACAALAAAPAASSFSTMVRLAFSAARSRDVTP